MLWTMTIRYWPFYCEENIWHLCEDPVVEAPVEERKVIVITGVSGRVAMRRQREGGARPVFWDYHVVLAAQGRIWDLDTTLGLPVELARWTRESFLPHYRDFAPRFRVVDAPTFRARFASDRSHMRGPDGAPLRPPPPWPPIGEGMTLPRFIDMDADFVGEVHDLGSLLL
jgi:hypothetical protein